MFVILSPQHEHKHEHKNEHKHDEHKEHHDHSHDHKKKEEEDNVPAWKKRAMEADPTAAPFGGSWGAETSMDATK